MSPLDRCAINVKPLLFNLVRERFLYNHFMGRFERTVYPLGPCLTALRVLSKSNNSNRYILVERHIDEYLRTHPFSLAHALERLRRAIDHEEVEGHGDYWGIVKEYVRSLHRMT